MDNRQATNRIYQAQGRVTAALRILSRKFDLSTTLDINVSASRDPLAAAVVQCDLCASLFEARAAQVDTLKSAPVNVPILVVTEQMSKPKPKSKAKPKER